MIKKIIFILLFHVNLIIAQPDAFSSDSTKTFMLNILSNLDNAKIYFDTTYVGQTPLKNLRVKEGLYNIKLINTRSLSNWENENKIIYVYINRDTTIYTNFKYYYSINSNPFDAIVYKNDSSLGNTPLRFFSENKLSGYLILKKKNYLDHAYDLKDYNFDKGVNITLKPKFNETINDIVYKNRGTQFKTKRDIFAISGLGVAALVGGYMAINFKNKANDAYNKYLLDANPENLNTSNRNDTYFTISLVLMQAAIGGLIYFLFFD